MRIAALALVAGLPVMFAPITRRRDLSEGSGEIASYKGHGRIKYSLIRFFYVNYELKNKDYIWIILKN